jgi:outer membrane usher protein
VSGKYGGQVSGSFETALWKARLYLSSLRSFGDYQDLASVTAPKQQVSQMLGPTIAAATGAVYKRQDQISLSLPLTFDAGSLNFSYTDAEDAANNAYKIASVSYSRPFFWNSSLSLTGFNDFDQSNSWGVYAGLTFSWGRYSAGAIEQSSNNSYSAGGYFSRSLGDEAGSYGYSVRAQEGSNPVNSGSFSYRAQEAQLDAGVQQVGRSAQATASAQGSVAIMNGVYFANRIDNSFAIVDTGIPGVTVLRDNHPVGETDSDGRILIPSIRAREENSITIDPATLPIQADIDVTQLVAVPKQRGGTSVHFKGNAQPASAVVVFKDEKGAVIPPGSEAWVNGAQDSFVIGYDGETYLTNLQPSNTALVKLPDGRSCKAAFDFAPQQGSQARIDNVVCTASAPAVAAAESAPDLTVKSK